MASKILITGGTGTLGKALCGLLTELNILYTVGSRTPGKDSAGWVKMDLLKKEGLKEAVAGKDIIFHLATDLAKDSESTKHLLDAIGDNKSLHFIYISIVGVDKIPFAYYKQKLESEQAIAQSGISFTILRATQFHEFIDALFSKLLKFPVGLLPKKIISQPVQKEVVASKLYELSTTGASNGIFEMGGRQTFTLLQLANTWLTYTGRKRLIMNLPLFGKLGHTFYRGDLTTKSSAPESEGWSDWLRKKYLS